MFDITAPDGTEYKESASFKRGEAVVTYDCEGVTVGCAICYDLRFPALFQALADKGAAVIALPAAFTMQTGKDHWEVLCRARAIETETYFCAAAQTGVFTQGNETRQTYGHSLVADPWGHVIARASDGPGSVAARIDAERVARVRRMIPVAQHPRPAFRLERLIVSANSPLASDDAHLSASEARRSPEMEATWIWLLEQDAGLPNWQDLPPAEARRLHNGMAARWNAILPEMESVEPVIVPGSVPVPCQLIVPRGAEPGCILFLHGGGWAFGNLETHQRFMRLLARASRRRVLAVDYRLAPEQPLPGTARRRARRIGRGSLRQRSRRPISRARSPSRATVPAPTWRLG